MKALQAGSWPKLRHASFAVLAEFVFRASLAACVPERHFLIRVAKQRGIRFRRHSAHQSLGPVAPIRAASDVRQGVFSSLESLCSRAFANDLRGLRTALGGDVAKLRVWRVRAKASKIARLSCEVCEEHEAFRWVLLVHYIPLCLFASFVRRATLHVEPWASGRQCMQPLSRIVAGSAGRLVTSR